MIFFVVKNKYVEYPILDNWNFGLIWRNYPKNTFDRNAISLWKVKVSKRLWLITILIFLTIHVYIEHILFGIMDHVANWNLIQIAFSKMCIVNIKTDKCVKSKLKSSKLVKINCKQYLTLIFNWSKMKQNGTAKHPENNWMFLS